MTTTIPLADFVAQHRVKMTAEWAAENPNMEGSDMMDNWKCVLSCGKRRMTLHFSKGTGHNGAEPTADEVLDCLASDASSVENARSFEEWASEYGYDTDSRKAEKIFKTCERQAEKLKQLLGDAAYEQLLWNTDRL